MPLDQIKISSEDLKISRTIIIAINIGATLFAFVSLYFYLTNEHTSHENNLSDILLLVLFVVSLTSYIVYTFIPKKVLLNSLMKNKEELIAGFNSYTIIRMAILEAPTLFGLVILIITIQAGSIYIYDYYFLALIPLFILYAISIITFPRIESTKSIIHEVLKKI